MGKHPGDLSEVQVPSIQRDMQNMKELCAFGVNQKVKTAMTAVRKWKGTDPNSKSRNPLTKL
jgi:hypothetical protein